MEKDKEWEELVSVVTLSNKGEKSEAIKLAVSYDLNGKRQLLSAILNCFEITPVFISAHINETYKIITAADLVDLDGFRDSFRLGFIKSIFSEICANN